MVSLVYDKRNCVGCPPYMGCLGKMCPYCWEATLKCDECGEEVEDLYRLDGDDLCDECFRKAVEKIHITYDNCGDFVD